MKRIDAILHHPLFTQTLTRLEALEADRMYCHHGLPHLLDTARIAYILQCEEYKQQPCALPPLPAEQIYAAALLHDIGRVRQYEEGIPHETAGLPLAKQILSECDFDEEEQTMILSAIRFHRSLPPSADTAVNSNPDITDSFHYKKPIKLSNQIEQSKQTKQFEQTGRSKQVLKSADHLRALLRHADDLSRCCFCCPSSETCYWSNEKKNSSILW